MDIVAKVLVLLVAVIHLYFLFLEMVLWSTPRGRAVFGTTAEFAEQSKALAANQGLYNGFLAAGLVVGVVADSFLMIVFTLACVVVAGLYGAATVTKRILLVQALPGAVALVVAVLAH